MATPARTLSDLIIPQPSSRVASYARDALLIVGGSLIVAALARVSIPLQPVPVTGQTLGVLLVGAALGWQRGGLALIVYLVEGLVGLPVFAEGKVGLAVLQGSTGGYLVGFILAAALVGFLAEHGWDRTPWLTAAAMVLGNVAIYIVGVTWLTHVLSAVLPFNTAFHTAIQFGVSPFLIGDAIKIIIAAALLPTVTWLVRRNVA